MNQLLNVTNFRWSSKIRYKILLYVFINLFKITSTFLFYPLGLMSLL